jgi:glutamine cyclotransferase
MTRVDLESGRTLASVNLPKREFGEGAVLLDSVIYQITWREGVAHVYDVPSLKERATIKYAGEGWGIATDGEWLYMSDGSDKIYKLDPATFKRKMTIPVTYNGQPLSLINEMEWIDGKLWANVYLTDKIVVIDPATGQVEGVLDFAGLLSESEMDSKTDVLNGIAYDEATGRIFITGKNWPKLFEIEVIK